MSSVVLRSLTIGMVLIFGACSPTHAGDEKEKASVQQDETVEKLTMTSDRMVEVIKNFDSASEANGNRIVFNVRERELMIVFDNDADRMRIITPILQASAVPSDVHERMLQANFDAVLDSRYAIANDVVWSTFIHRLSTLDEDDLLSAIAQTYAAAETFGTTYTSGVIVFGGGDSNSLHEELLEELEKLPKKEDTGI